MHNCETTHPTLLRLVFQVEPYGPIKCYYYLVSRSQRKERLTAPYLASPSSSADFLAAHICPRPRARMTLPGGEIGASRSESKKTADPPTNFNNSIPRRTESRPSVDVKMRAAEEVAARAATLNLNNNRPNIFIINMYEKQCRCVRVAASCLRREESERGKCASETVITCRHHLMPTLSVE